LALLWSFDDQQTIKPISANNEGKWEQLATEVQLIKLKELMGADFVQDVLANPTGTWNKKLIDGDTYDISEVSYTFAGLKYVLSFLFYERYIMEIDAQDTFAGMMRNENENAAHISFAQKKNMAQEMRRIANDHWKDCYQFVCENSDEFPYAAVKTSGRFYFI
jgi:hypothetical protein